MQTAYSKAKGGVDGVKQFPSILRSQAKRQSWEQKLVTQSVKSVCTISLLPWRQMKRKELLIGLETFKDVDTYRAALKRVSSFADWVRAVSFELIAHGVALDHAAGAHSDCSPPQESSWGFNDEKYRAQANTLVARAYSLSTVEKHRLRGLVGPKKSGHLAFCNSEDGTTIHLYL